MTLTEDQRLESSILFLAEHAPLLDTPAPGLGAGGFFVGYHHRLFQALCALGLAVTPCRDLDQLLSVAPRHDYVFTVYNRVWTRRMRNSMVFVSSVCDYLHVPYLGAPPNVRALAEDKYMTKALASSVGIPVLPGKVFHDLGDLDRAPDFDGPYFVKPRFGAASENIGTDSLQHTWPGARAKVRELLALGLEALVERGVVGTDITVPVVGGRGPLLFPPIARPSGLEHGITTYQQKMFLSRPQQFLEDASLQEELGQYALRLGEEARPFDYFRADFRRDDATGEVFLLEFNVACVLDEAREFGVAGRRLGISFPALLGHIIAYSLARQRAPR